MIYKHNLMQCHKVLADLVGIMQFAEVLGWNSPSLAWQVCSLLYHRSTIHPGCDWIIILFLAVPPFFDHTSQLWLNHLFSTWYVDKTEYSGTKFWLWNICHQEPIISVVTLISGSLSTVQWVKWSIVHVIYIYKLYQRICSLPMI